MSRFDPVNATYNIKDIMARFSTIEYLNEFELNKPLNKNKNGSYGHLLNREKEYLLSQPCEFALSIDESNAEGKKITCVHGKTLLVKTARKLMGMGEM